MSRNRRWLSDRPQKIAFLAEHPELWSKPELEIQRAMVEAKLCSALTTVSDLHIALLIEQAKQVKS